MPGQYIELAANDAVLPRRAGDPPGDLPGRHGCRRAAQPAAGRRGDATETCRHRAPTWRRVAAKKDLRSLAASLPRSSGTCCSTSATPATPAGPSHAERPDVRRAIGLALDRRVMVRAVRNAAEVPYGPASPMLWIRHGAPAARWASNVARGPPPARRAPAGPITTATASSTGMARPLALTMPLPITSADPRADRRCRCRSSCARSASARDRAGRVPAVQRAPERRTVRPGFRRDEPGPVCPRGWPRAGRAAAANNVGRFCDPVVDSLLDAAALGTAKSGAGVACRPPADREPTPRRCSCMRTSYMYAVRPALRQRAHPARVALARPPRVDRGRGRATEVRRWLARRTLQAALTLLIALVLLFLLIHVLPGDPLSPARASAPLTAAADRGARARYGLDRPLSHQLGAFLGGLSRATSASRSSTAGR